MSVMAISEPIWIEVRSSVVVALSLVSKALLKPVPVRESDTTKLVIVEEAELIRMPAEVEVGRMTLAAKVSHMPALPEAVQELPVPVTAPLVSTLRHWVEPVIVLMVRAPAMVTAPLRRVVPRTPSVVEGALVLMPTLPVAPSAHRTGVSMLAVDEAILKYPVIVVVASSLVLVSTRNALF
jgi:hypothetical protein